MWLCLEIGTLSRQLRLHEVIVWGPNVIRTWKQRLFEFSLPTHTVPRHARSQRRGGSCRPQWESSPEANAVVILVLNLQSPEERKKEFLLLKPPNLYFVMSSPKQWTTNLSLFFFFSPLDDSFEQIKWLEIRIKSIVFYKTIREHLNKGIPQFLWFPFLQNISHYTALKCFFVSKGLGILCIMKPTQWFQLIF